MRAWPVLLLTSLLVGCLSDGTGPTTTPAPVPGHAWRVADVGMPGAEPTLGVASDGSIFFQAYEKTMRSQDHGATWQDVTDALAAPTTLDPMMWLDPATDRVYTNQLYVGCSYLSWSDDLGETWMHNPAACGLPVNDHQKVATGPHVEGSPLAPAGGAVYPNVVYYAYNQVAGGRVAMSVDGGLTFPYSAATFTLDCEVPGGQRAPVGGLHGHVTAGPDGTVYIPARNCGGPIVAASDDNGLTWRQVEVAPEVGTSDHDKNPEVAIDVEDTVYLAWPGADNRLFLAHSEDRGRTWSNAVAVTPGLGTVTMPVIQAGDAGRVAIAYYAVGDPDVLEAPDLVPEDTRWDLFATVSLDAKAAAPVFETVRVTKDPVQIGPISTNSGDAPSGSRNLLDFIDMVLDAEGRPYVAFADGCTGACAEDWEDATMQDSRDDRGKVAILVEGPSLLMDAGTLRPLAA